MKSEQVVSKTRLLARCGGKQRSPFTYTPNGPYARSTFKDSAAHRGPAGASSVTA